MFWDQEDTAGPSMMDVARFWDRQPRYLRTTNRGRPSPFSAGSNGNWMSPTFLLPVHATAVADFWATHYGGTDWRFVLDVEDVQDILREDRILALGVFNSNRTLVGTIVARPLTDMGVKLCIGSTGRAEGAYVVEGLCIDPAWRGKHLAGWLISWVDFLLSRERPRLYVWSRESPTALSLTNIASAQYAYIHSSRLPADLDPQWVTEMSWSSFREAWVASTPHWSSATAMFPTALPKTAKHLEIWRHELWGIVLVLSDTRRRIKRTEEKIWELQWCGSVSQQGLLQPWATKGDARVAQMLAYILSQKGGQKTKNAAAAARTGAVLFVTDAPHQGGATTEWGDPWVFGTSGYHNTYVYNYMPPAFWSMTVMLPRWEL